MCLHSAMKAAARRRITEAADYLDAAPVVVNVVRDTPVSEHDDRIPTKPADPDALAALTERYGLGRAVQRLADVLAAR